MIRKLSFLIMLFIGLSVSAQQYSIQGRVVDSERQTGIPNAKISTTSISHGEEAHTNKKGEFLIRHLNNGSYVLTVEADGYESTTYSFNIENSNIYQATIALRKGSGTAFAADETSLFDESLLDEDESSIVQSTAYLSSSSDDIYLKTASYNYSPMRFNIRGYDYSAQTTYINGVNFNDQERGRFNYSGLGGLNDAFRNKDVINGLDNNAFSFGNIGGVTNIDTRASSYAAGGKAGLAYTNRAYNLRANATYATGLMENGWAFTASAVYRWSKEGRTDGTFYDSFGYFLAAEKRINRKHSIALTTFGAPTQRAQSAAVTQEVYDLAQSGIYYNPYWGYQKGEKRNSRVVKSFDPTVILNWDYKIDNKQTLKTGVGFHYSNYSNSALAFYNAPDPRPDYYRNLPSYQVTSQANNENVDWEMHDYIKSQWENNNTDVTQVNWDALYQANYRLNANNPNACAKYIVERRHNNLMQTTLNSTYTNRFSEKTWLNAGIEVNYSKGMHYKTIDDLLGGNQWIDIDQFSERDFANNDVIIQNDLRNPNRMVRNGDKFGYNYNMHIIKANAFVSNSWNLPYFDINYAAKLSYTTFQREGLMENGRAKIQNVNSYGKGKRLFFLDPSFRFGVTYKISGRHRLALNGLVETRAPYAGDSYVAVRIKDSYIKGLTQEKVFSGDLSYMFSTPHVQGRITGFYTHMTDGTESLGYYDDGFRTFINHTLSGVTKAYRGVEVGLNFKINSSFSVVLAGTYADQRYMNNAIGTMSAESGITLKQQGDLAIGELPRTPEEARNADITETVYTKNLRINNGPQLAATLTLDYFHPKMWFADISLNYFDQNYLSFAPSHFTRSNYEAYTDEQRAVLGVQEKLKGGFMLDASVGKVIYLKNRQSLNINLSFNNILNNEDMVTGGYQQGRISRDSKTSLINSTSKFPNKYYYAWGFNCFLNIGYKF